MYSRKPNRIPVSPTNDPKLNGGLVRDCQPIFEARFSCREPDHSWQHDAAAGITVTRRSWFLRALMISFVWTNIGRDVAYAPNWLMAGIRHRSLFVGPNAIPFGCVLPKGHLQTPSTTGLVYGHGMGCGVDDRTLVFGRRNEPLSL